MSDETITINEPDLHLSNVPPLTAPNMVTGYDRFWAGGREFNRQDPGSLIWLSADGWRFWLGEEVRQGMWTMGADRGQGESVFAFGIFDSVEATFAELERLAAK